jgi:peptidoglycan/LPS O-acetylase OafA/YrhL
VAGNNFKLLRLLVAIKVVVGHAIGFQIEDLPYGISGLYTVLRFFPGVPVFFAMSGYLLARSLDYKPDLRSYARSRMVRIFPALWACGLATFVLLAGAGLLFQLPPHKLVAFVVAQLTIGQTWAPFPISEYGLGTGLTPNPALWTIRVSIGFYLVLPILLILGPRLVPWRRWLDAVFVAIAGVSFGCYALFGNPANDASSDPIIIRLLANSPAPYLWLLLAGILVYRYESAVKRALVGHLGLWLCLFLAVRGAIWLAFQAGEGPDAELPFAALGAANLIGIAPAFALAFSPSPFLRRLDPTNDLSYSMYLWHMVFLNALVHWNLGGDWLGVAAVVAGSTLAAKISWHTVEAPALARKRRRTPAPAAEAPVTAGYPSPA